MEFKKREEYSIDTSGVLFQVSQDEFVHSSIISNPRVIIWMNGNKHTEKEIENGTPSGVVGNSFFFVKGDIIKKAELNNDQIVIVDNAKIAKGTQVYFQRFCPHYFIERDNISNVSFAIPINEDYQSNNGIKFNVSIDELKKYFRIHVHDNFLFGITKNEHSSSIRRHQSDSEEYLERKELPTVWISARLVIFNSWIFYLSVEGDFISVILNDLSYEIMKTNLEEWTSIVGIDEKGMVNVQSPWAKPTVHLLAAKIPEKYIAS